MDSLATSSSTRRGKLKRWYTQVALAVFNGLLLFLVVNLILYAIIRVRRPAKPQAQTETQAQMQTPLEEYGIDKLLKAYPGWKEGEVRNLVSENYRESRLEFEPFTGFRQKPVRGKFVNVDPAGFRFSKDQAPWPPRSDTVNVFVFGGSTTFGFGLPDDETIASYLQECAPANRSGGFVSVYNFGREGYFSSQELVLFQQLLKSGFVPQVAVFIDGLNDFWIVNGPLYTERLRDVFAWKEEHSPLDDLPMIRAAYWMAARWRSQPQQPVDTPGRNDWEKPESEKPVHDTDRALLEGIVDRWLANKRMIEAVARDFGVRPIFVWQPVPAYKYDTRYDLFFRSYPVYTRCRYGYALMDNLRAEGKLGTDVLWLADMQQDKQENLYVDTAHYTAAFSREIAAQICGFLRQHPEQSGPKSPVTAQKN
ncbi:MAG TPA: SGNH/GDSL hydrolase family protein [Terriglobales bacterium]|nr:SGNH/GDSL hydrolase family protein [Terriglobales bacterium]